MTRYLWKKYYIFKKYYVKDFMWNLLANYYCLLFSWNLFKWKKSIQTVKNERNLKKEWKIMLQRSLPLLQFMFKTYKSTQYYFEWMEIANLCDEQKKIQSWRKISVKFPAQEFITKKYITKLLESLFFAWRLSRRKRK